jgi:phosphoribosylformylglycinamidine synthase
VAGPAPHLDLTREKALHRLLVHAIRDGVVESAHDCAEGGLATTLAECCFDTPYGVDANLPAAGAVPPAFAVQAALFGESASRVVVSARPEQLDRLQRMAGELAIPWQVIGTTGGDRIVLKVNGQTAIDVDAKETETRWATAIETAMTRRGRETPQAATHD